MKPRLCLFWLFFLLFSCENKQEIGKKTAGNKQTQVQNDSLKNADFEYFCNNYFVPAVNSDDENALENLINPDLGLFLAYKPTAFPVVNRFSSFSDLLSAQPDFFLLVNKFPKVKKGGLPAFVNCEFFSQEGAFFEKISLQKNIEERAKVFETDGKTTFSEEEMTIIREADRKTTVRLLLTSSCADFYFAYCQGKWCLTFIDFTRYDCSI
jgi:hypothetical protein